MTIEPFNLLRYKLGYIKRTHGVLGLCVQIVKLIWGLEEED